MHELSLAMSVKEIVETAARENCAKSVKEITIVVGKFSSVAPDAMSFAMDVAKKNSVFEEAEIIIKEIDTVLSCSKCGEESVMENFEFRCGSCGSGNVQIISGDRMYVESIDIDREEKCTT